MARKQRHVYVLLQDLNAAGIQRTFLRLAIGMHQAGAKVTILTCWNVGPLAEMLPPEIPLIVLADDIAARKSVSLLAKHLRKDKPDALMAGDDPTNVCAISAKLLALSKTRVVIGIHNSLKMKAENDPLPSVRRKMKLLQFFYKFADRIVAVSQGVKKDMVEFTKIPAEKVEVVNNPVIGSDLATKGEEPWDPRPFVGSQDPTLLALGRLHEQKDYETMFQAIKIVLEKRPVNLVIYGEGHLRPEFEARLIELNLQDRVVMPGAVPNPYPAMKASDVYVMSSLWEGAPSVLVEALYFNMPIVSTNCTWGPGEILEDGKWGRLVPVKNPHELADGILQALTEGKKVLAESSWNRYTIETAVENYLRVLFD